jgi:predicted MPP superfamily phosphohydrolase
MKLTESDPQGYRARPLHIALLLTDLLGLVHPLILTPIWLALAVAAGWPWGINLGPTVAVLSTAFIAVDTVMLILLPRLGRSYGPPTPPLLGLAIVRTILTAAVGLLWPAPAGLWLTAVLQLAISAVAIYGTWIEPFHLGTTRAELHSPKLDGRAPLRLLHISDLHVERITPRDRELLRLVKDLAPDVIVLTGDYLNLSCVHDGHGHAEARELLAQLCETAPVPVYAVTGSPPVDRAEIVPAIFDGLPITWLQDETDELHAGGHTLRIAGLRCTRERLQDGPRLRELLAGSPDHTFTLLLYHSPDLMPDAVELGIDLYLCGHTHGGQIRFPLFGALITSSDFWKRYEMGRYEEGNTTLYVSRGLGMEGKGAPRARFLAPPEIILWTLSGSADTA